MKVFLAMTLSLCAALSTVTTIPVDSNPIDVFDRLDDYSILDVLDFLKYSDLVSLASISPRNHDLIMNHYIRPKFGAHNTKLRVHVTDTDSFNAASYLREGVDYDYLTFCSGQECTCAALKVLCPISSGLEIILAYNKRFDEVLTQKVATYVTSYCAGAPQTMKMLGIRDSVGEFQFPHVKSVFIENPELFSHFDLAYSFPHVERLAIDIFDHFTIAQHFPNLTHFQLHDLTCGHFDLKAFGEKNPQIRSIELEICGQIENIDEVNELFLDLESLYLKLEREFPSNDSTDLQKTESAGVRFRNVTKFFLDISKFYGRIHATGAYIPLTLDNLKKDQLMSIEFDRLKSLGYVSRMDVNLDYQIDFVARYKDVMSLDFSGIVLQYDEMKRLVDSLPKLKEITLLCGPSGPDDIGRLMQETRLEAIRVVAGGRYRKEFRAQVVLPDGWFLDAEKDASYYKVFIYEKRVLLLKKKASPIKIPSFYLLT